MPTTITDVDEFTDPIEGPADADPQAAAAYLPGYQGLANRTRNNLNRLEALNPRTGTYAGEYLYPTPPTRTRIAIDIMEGIALPDTAWNRPTNLLSGTDSRLRVSDAGGQEVLYLPLNRYLKHRCRIVSLSMMGKPGSDPGGGSGDRMICYLFRTPALNFGSPAKPAAPTAIVAAELPGTAAVATTTAVAGTEIAILHEDGVVTPSVYYLVVHSTNAAVNDELYALAITIEENQVG